jgi:cell division protein FtsN
VRKAKPRVSLNVALSAFLAAILGIFWAFFAEYLEKVKSRRWETLESGQPSETSTLAPPEDEEGERQRKAIGSSVNESKGRKARKAAGG